MTVKVDIIDQSTRGSAYDWDKIAHAIEAQVRLHVAQAWGIGNAAQVRVKDALVPGHWPVYILDDSDVDGALGYHTTDDNYPTLPVGKIFVKTDEKYGLLPSVTLSHEVVEIFGDPMAQYTFQATATQFWAVELCDPVEADALGYEFQGVQVSDFVLPAWFYGGPGPFSFMKRVNRARTLTRGGYQAYFDTISKKWTQITAQAEPGVASRAETMTRVEDKRALQFWAEAIPQQTLQMPED